MDRTDAPVAPPDSQSRISASVWWVLAAAVLFRILTAVMDRAAQPERLGEVRWQPREKAAALARESRKPILYDFTAAWCGPCRLLDRDWEDASVAQAVNASFVPVRIVDREREDGANPADIAELQRRFEVSGFPTLAAADADGRLIGKIEGYAGRPALMRFLESSKGKAAP